ncbi:MAG: hypothetical protein IIA44_01155, partial [Acidobacteria bacterium]|nr:hypothetical protein [Acidobacteriota bacterium]
MKSRPIGLRPAALLLVGVIALVVGSANVDAFASSNQKTTHPALSVQAAAPPCGDLNGDGAVNVFDAITLLQIIVGIVTPDATQSALADFDQNESVNVFDAITLLQIIVGLIPSGDVVCGAVTTPPGIDLLDASDTGASNTDDVTGDNTPTLSVTASAGVLVRLFVDAALVGQATTDASGVAEFTTGVLADGIRTFTAEADEDGTTTPADPLEVVVDTAVPTTVIAAPAEGGGVFPGNQLVGSFDGTGSDIDSASYRFGALADIPLAFGPDTGAFSQTLDLAGIIAAGSQVLTVTVADLAGNQFIDTVNVDVFLQLPFTVAAQTPLSGAVDVGVTFKPQVFFSVPVDPATLNGDNFFAEAGGQVLPATIVPANDGLFVWLFFTDPMPSSAVVEVTVDGAAITPDGGGPFLDADGDGQPGGVLIYSFSTVSVEPLPNTTLTGIIVDPGPDTEPMTADDFDPGPDGIPHTADDIFLLPIAGVEVSIIGVPGTVVTDANGEFLLDPVPGGQVKLDTNGMTATTPAEFYFPEMVMAVDVTPGTENFPMPGMRHMYLPRIPTAILNTVSSADTTMIVANEDSAPDLTPEQRGFLTIEIQPNSLIGPDGQPVANAQIGISTVPPELVMDMLPPGVLQHTFDITVQALGVSNFSVPAPMTFPNVFGAPPGSKLNFLSFDHTTGLLVIEGTATVSADGLSVSTDPDTGITHPGWHGLTPPGTENSPPCDPTAVHDIMVDPIPVTAGLVDHFTKDDSGNWTYSFGNAAKLQDASKDPCHPENIRATPLVVMITVDGPAGQFLTGLSSQTFELMPGQQKNIQFEVKPLIPGVKDVDKDQLYGVRVIIKGWKHGEPGADPLPLDEKVYVYRFFDVADDDHDDGVVEFADTLNDGVASVQRPRVFEQHMHSAPPPTLTVASATHFAYLAGTIALFDPRATGTGLTTTLAVKNPEGAQVGTLTMKGEGTPKNKIALNKPALLTVLKAIADGTAANVNNILVTDNEKALFDTADERVAFALAMETRYKSLYSAFAEGLEYVAADGANTINYKWLTAANSCSFGTSKKVAGDDGVDDIGKMTTAVKDRNKYNVSERNFRLAQTMNQDFKTNVYVNVDSFLECALVGGPLELT